jgi:hypothetical protein
MTWQDLASSSVVTFQDVDTLSEKKLAVEAALLDLTNEIVRIAGAEGKSGLSRALDLRSRPRAGHKSAYECLNQLIHYWYCCSAGHHLFDLGARTLEMRPTGHGSKASDGEHGFDIAVRQNQELLICAEVFCVSAALWGQKIAKTAKKLVTAKNVPATAYRLIYCNEQGAQRKCTELPGVIVCSIQPSGAIQLVRSNDQRVRDSNALSALLTPVR